MRVYIFEIFIYVSYLHAYFKFDINLKIDYIWSKHCPCIGKTGSTPGVTGTRIRDDGSLVLQSYPYLLPDNKCCFLIFAYYEKQEQIFKRWIMHSIKHLLNSKIVAFRQPDV